MKNLTPIIVVLGVAGIGFAVYWFGFRPIENESCTDCGDTSNPFPNRDDLKNLQSPTLQKYRGDFPAGQKGWLPPRTPPSIRPNVEKAL